MEGKEIFFVLQIDHPVINFENWMTVFESDPAHRKQSGVKRYRVSKVIDDPDLVTIDLEFKICEDAEAFLKKMQRLWMYADEKIVRKPYARVIEVIENNTY